MFHGYFHFSGKGAHPLLNLEIAFLCQGLWYLCDCAVLQEILQYVAVKDGNAFAAANVAQEVRCLLVADAVDVLDEPFAALARFHGHDLR